MNNIKTNAGIFCTLLFLLFTACKEANQQTTEPKETKVEKKDPRALPEWAKSATIYEVNLRQFTPEGTFIAFSKHLPRLKELGVDILWFMPIYPISKAKRKGRLGSYYAVADYKATNPEFGTIEDFDNMVKQIKELGMHIILDWVPNHTGWDHAWITDHPDWYTQNAEGEIIDPIDPGTGESWGWTDVADLNYDNMDMRNEMISDKMFWINEHGIDGFREDVAHNVPDSFWDAVAEAVYATDRDIFMLAEAEVPAHRNSRNFHMGYGWSAHHLLNEIAHGEKSVSDIDAWFVEDRKNFAEGIAMHFTSNHDENTWAGTVFERMGDAHLALAALTFTFDGMPLIYGGQEEPMKKRLKFFEKDDIGFSQYAYTDFYKKLNDLKESNQALWNGEYGGTLTKLIDHPQVYVFEREKNGDTVSCIFNLSDKRQSITLPKAISAKDIMSGQQINWKTETALGLEPWQYYILSSQ